MATADVLRTASYLQRQAARLRQPGTDGDAPDLVQLALADAADAVAAASLASSATIVRIRNQARVAFHKGDMPDAGFSMWRHLLTLDGPAHNGAWIRFTGVSRDIYDELVQLASKHESYRARPDVVPPGGHWVMGSQDALGLALRYMVSTDDTIGLMVAFYCSSSLISGKLKEGLTLLWYALQRHPDAYVRFLSKAEQVVHGEVIMSHGKFGGNGLSPTLCDYIVFGWVDGFAVPITRPDTKERERMWYACKHQACVASNLVALDSQGLIMWYKVNIPGSINDTDACAELTELLRDPSITVKKGVLMGDAAFGAGAASGAHEAYLSPKTVIELTASTGDAAALGYWLLARRQAVEVCMH